jgi:hypothetical protein
VLANGSRLPSGVYVISYSNTAHNHDMTASIDPTMPSDEWLPEAYKDLTVVASPGAGISNSFSSSSSSSSSNMVTPESAADISGEVVDISRSQTLHLRHQLNELASLLCAEGSGVHYSNLLFLLRHIYETKGTTLAALRQTVDTFNSKAVPKKKSGKKRKDYDDRDSSTENGISSSSSSDKNGDNNDIVSDADMM